MMFMSKSQHRRNDLVRSVSSNISPETPQVKIGNLPADRKSKMHHALLIVGILVGVCGFLITPMIFWLS